MNSRSPGRKSPTKRTVTSWRPDSASARRNGFGSRLPKNEPACVSRKRSPRTYSMPAKSSKSQPFRDRHDATFGSSPRVSTAIDSAAHTIASAFRATRCATPATRLLLRALADPVGGAVRVQCDRVAEIGHPFRAGRPSARPRDQVHRARRRGREHDVDPLAPRDRDRLRDCGRVPGHVLVRQQQTAADRAGAQKSEVDAAPAVELVGDPPSARPDVAGRDGSRPASAAGGRRPHAPFQNRPARARASRSRAPADGSRT